MIPVTIASTMESDTSEFGSNKLLQIRVMVSHLADPLSIQAHALNERHREDHRQ